MPTIHYCINHDYCRGYADKPGGLCTCCQEAQDPRWRKQEQDLRYEEIHERLTQKPSRAKQKRWWTK